MTGRLDRDKSGFGSKANDPPPIHPKHGRYPDWERPGILYTGVELESPLGQRLQLGLLLVQLPGIGRLRWLILTGVIVG